MIYVVNVCAAYVELTVEADSEDAAINLACGSLNWDSAFDLQIDKSLLPASIKQVAVSSDVHSVEVVDSYDSLD